MNEENLMNESLEEANEAASEIIETSEEIIETAEEAEGTTEELISTETEEIPKLSREDLGNAPEITTSGSEKKLTAVYLGLIAVLIVLVIVLGVMIAKKFTDNKANPEVPENGTTVTASPDAGTADAATPTHVITYDVTTVLGQYKGIEVEYPDVTVTDAEVEDELEAFIEENSEYIDVTDRPAALGDTAVIDFAGYLDGVAFDGGTDEDYELELGSHNFIDGFEDGIVGHNIGDEFDLPLTFPENYNDTLGGKDVIFKITVKNILAPFTPELTDEFIAENTDYETVDAYSEYLRESLLEEKTAAADEQVNELILEKLVESCTFGGDIDSEIDAAIAENKQYYDSMAQSYYGIDGKTLFFYFYGFSEEEYEEHIYKQSMASVKTRYALEEVAKAEGLDLTDEEFTAYFNELFVDYYGYPSAEEVYADYSELYTKEELDEQVRKSAMLDRAQEFVINNARINK